MLRKVIRQAFCVNWSNSYGNVMAAVKKQVSSDPNFIRDNGAYLMHYLADLVQSSQWSNALQFVKSVNTNTIDKWDLWVELSKVITSQISKVHDLNYKQFDKCLQFIQKVRYQPKLQQDQVFYKFIEDQLKNENMNTIMKLASFLLGLNSNIFDKFSREIYQQIKTEISTNGQLSDVHRFTLVNGIMSGFWSKELIQKIPLGDPVASKYITLTDPNTPLRVTASKDDKTRPLTQKRTNTETKIGEMLVDLGYVIEQNVYVNGLQVDFLVGKRLIIEYNGMLHYRINSRRGHLDPTKYESWRIDVLSKKGFTVLSIPFLEWSHLQNERVQKMYLIQRLEKVLLQSQAIKLNI